MNAFRSFVPAVRPRGCFTLVELLVVMAIIAILSALLFPSLGQARKKARDIVCSGNQRQIGVMLNLYVADFNGYYPTRRFDYYLIKSGAMKTPSAAKTYASANPAETKVSYAYQAVVDCPFNAKLPTEWLEYDYGISYSLGQRDGQGYFNNYWTIIDQFGRVTQIPTPSRRVLLCDTYYYIVDYAWTDTGTLQPGCTVRYRHGNGAYGPNGGMANFLHADNHVDMKTQKQWSATTDAWRYFRNNNTY